MQRVPLPVTRLRPSRGLLRAVTGVYVAGALLTLHLPVPAPWRVGVLAVLIVDHLLTRRRLGRCHGLQALRITTHHQLQARDGGGWQDVHPLAPCYRFPGLIILRVIRRGRVQSWFLLPGMMEPDAWRQLSIWVRWRLPELLPPRPSLWQRVRAALSRSA